MFLYITSSRGLFKYNIVKKVFEKILSNWNKGLFSRPSKGFFGISHFTSKNYIVCASRENFNKEIKYEKSTSSTIHIIDITKNIVKEKIIIDNILDIHQIFYNNNLLFLTETGKNRIQILNIENKKVENFIDVGEVRNDINHLNAVTIYNDKLLIGLNNGNIKNLNRNSQIIEVNLSILGKLKNFDALKHGFVNNLKDVYETHDIEKYNDDFLISSSNTGKIYSLKQKKFIKDIKPWTRGIAIGDKNIYIGKSGIGKRYNRHSRYYNGEIFVLDKINLEIKEIIKVPGIGQLNDIIYV